MSMNYSTPTGIATLVAPRGPEGNYELHMHGNPLNATSTQSGSVPAQNPTQAQTPAQPCVSFKALREFLIEESRHNGKDRVYIPGIIDVSGKEFATTALNYFKTNPKAADGLDQVLSHASCGDIAHLIEAIPAGIRDATIVQSMGEIREQVPLLANQLGVEYQNTQTAITNAAEVLRSDLKTASQDIKNGAYALTVPLMIVAIAYTLNKLR